MANERPWYFKDSTVIMAVLGLLIFALPLVWFNPHYSWRTKIVVSVIVLVATYYTWQLTVGTLKALESYSDFLK
ncbi:MAG: hypothetical protein HQL20_08350 [Candidatus Omnitrophica bacterium]|nr:hypothetical protein [Candidatus Omnitrophota bacterium]